MNHFNVLNWFLHSLKPISYSIFFSQHELEKLAQIIFLQCLTVELHFLNQKINANVIAKFTIYMNNKSV